ncbi:hypothetical protein [Geobacter sp. SVR]|uniref:hypothetical protein n=1 Tax=Geobacter sp. SVR TaxID=2495594 RepID=UPI00143EF9D2|nr:hypothetical protein [Geobacter sp. SVR]BCS53434.1 hypothetical protein GSVR_17420 [Geobacter sp. SVR]GCF85439.1 hypothetical protein GSbR_20390 [Geobacter sp. SVR]
MKRITQITPVLAAALMIAAMPAHADEAAMAPHMQDQKNECLLVAMNCGSQVDSIQQRIERLNMEIGRGSAVYTRDELRQLNDQLDEAHRMLELIETGSGA